MKIGILVSGFPPDYIGGTELQARSLARELSRRHEVTVFTMAVRGRPGRERREGYEIRRIRYVDVPVLRYLTFSLFALAQVLGKGRKLDVLHCMYITPNGLVGALARILSGTPFITSIRDTKTYVKGGALGIINGFVFRMSSRIFIQAERQKEALLSRHRWLRSPKVRVIRNGIAPTRERAHGKAVLYLGRFTRMKGVENLIAAMRLIDGKDRPRLILAGYGPLEGRLRRMAEGLDVVFTGKVVHEDVRKVMSGAGIYVLPSIYGEGMPNTVLEAMSVGLPVIATRVIGIEGDLIEDCVDGLIVEPGNPEELAESIMRLSHDAKLRERLSRNGLKKVRLHDWATVTALIEEQMAEVARTGGRKGF